jgi:hypothetical protein
MDNNIKKFEEFVPSTGGREYEILGDKKKPSLIHSRRDQEFYDRYTRRKLFGKSKYELSTDVFAMASEKGNIGTLAQFTLQLERESIMSDVRLKEEVLSEVKMEIDSYFSQKEAELEKKLIDMRDEITEEIKNSNLR